MTRLLLLTLVGLCVAGNSPRASMQWLDEAERTSRMNHASCGTDIKSFFCDDDGLHCLPLTMYRDGTPDCPDHSDEYCGASEFVCGTACVASEAACKAKAKTKLCTTDLEVMRCRTWDECVLVSWALDGRRHCIDGSDEDCDYVQSEGRLPVGVTCAPRADGGSSGGGSTAAPSESHDTGASQATALPSTSLPLTTPTDNSSSTTGAGDTTLDGFDGSLSTQPDAINPGITTSRAQEIANCRAPLLAAAKGKYGASPYCSDIVTAETAEPSASVKLTAMSICGENFDSAAFERDQLQDPQSEKATQAAYLLLHSISEMFKNAGSSLSVTCIPKYRFTVGSIKFPISIACGNTQNCDIGGDIEQVLIAEGSRGAIHLSPGYETFDSCDNNQNFCDPNASCFSTGLSYGCACRNEFLDVSPNPSKMRGVRCESRSGSSSSSSTAAATEPTSTPTTPSTTLTTSTPSTSTSTTPAPTTTTPTTTTSTTTTTVKTTTLRKENDEEVVTTGGMSTTLLIVIIIAAIAGLLLLLCCGWWFCCRKRHQDEQVEPLAPTGRQAWSAESREPELAFRSNSGGSTKPGGPGMDPIRDTPTMWETYTGKAPDPAALRFQEQGRLSADKGARGPMVALPTGRRSVAGASTPSVEMTMGGFIEDDEEEDEAYERWKRHMAVPKSPNPSRYDDMDPHTPISPPALGGLHHEGPAPHVNPRFAGHEEDQARKRIPRY